MKADLEELKGQNDRLSTSNKVRKYNKDSFGNLKQKLNDLSFQNPLEVKCFRSYEENCGKAKISSIALSTKELSFR